MRKTNIQKVSEAFNLPIERFGDGSGTWVTVEDDKHVITISFNGKGNVFEGISIHKKIYQVVDSKLIAEINIKQLNT